MEKIKFFALGLCFLCILTVFGCGKEVSSANISRDDARTGGTLSFVYDKGQRTVFVGGESEVLQFSEKNEEKGYNAGNRVGLKITAPNEKLDLENAKFEMNGVNYSNGSFLETINGQKQRFFTIYPSFSEDERKRSFSLTWGEGTKKQDYKIVIEDGTEFLEKEA